MAFSHAKRAEAYKSVPQDEEASSPTRNSHGCPDCDNVSSMEHSFTRRRGFNIQSTFVSLFVFLLFSYSAYVTYELNRRTRSSWGTYEKGFATELDTATPKISLQQFRFGGDLKFYENGSSFLLPEPGRIRYAGPPSAEIDKNWHELVKDRYFYMTEAEAKRTWGEDYDGYYREIDGEKKYIGGLDILHTLHCLDTLRMHLDRDKYTGKYQRPSQNHNYHCIDQIRQYLMCNGDLTPVPTRWHKGGNKLYVESDMVHTCRNFDFVLDFARERAKAGDPNEKTPGHIH